jgi:hypothetical protein
VVNGTAYSFAINTGNSYSTVTEEIGSILASAGSVFDMGPKIALYDVPIFSGFFALAPSLDISSDFYITDGFLLDAGVDGILGGDLMRNSITDTFLSSLTINPDFPIIKEGGNLFVNLTIKNADGSKQKTVKLLVDTGAQGSLLRTATAQELGLSDTNKKVNLSGAGSGQAPVKKGTVDGVGEFEFVATDSIKDVLPKGVDGILGMNIVNSRTIINTKTNIITIDAVTKDIRRVTVTNEVPGPLPVMGVGIFGAYARRLKKLSSRLKPQHVNSIKKV